MDPIIGTLAVGAGVISVVCSIGHMMNSKPAEHEPDAPGSLFEWPPWCLNAQQGAEDTSLGQPQIKRPTLMKASRVKEAPIDWLIPDFLERGAITILGGESTAGKSTLGCAIAAAVSLGGQFNGKPIRPYSVLIFELEDSFATKTKPRLMAAGANMDNITSGDYIDLSDQGSVDWLDGYVNSNFGYSSPKLGLILISPMMNFFGRGGNTEPEVRARLQPFTTWLEKRKVAGLGIAHTKQGSGSKNADYAGSEVFVRASRAAWNIIQNDSDPTGQQKLLRAVATNNSAGGKEFPFHIEGVNLGGGIQATKIVWDEHTIKTAKKGK